MHVTSVPRKQRHQPPHKIDATLATFLVCLCLFISTLIVTAIPTPPSKISPETRKRETVDTYLPRNKSGLQLPYDVLVILPKYESDNDKFGLTIPKAMPVIDVAVEDTINKGLQPPGWIRLQYEDSRYWDDPILAEKWAVTAVVKAQCEGRLDAVIGFADAYSLATVAKISAGFGAGIPILTTTGNLDLLVSILVYYRF
jgi:hypothetical protein